jgi:hypothetical protein
VIFNDDCDDVTRSSSADAFLKTRLIPLIEPKDSPVDLVMFACFTTDLSPMYPTPIPQFHGSTPHPTIPTAHYYLENQTQEPLVPMLQQGDDPLRVAIDYCHSQDRSDTAKRWVDIFVSFRMNDNQDIVELQRSDWCPFAANDPPPHTNPESQRFLDNFDTVYDYGIEHGEIGINFSRWKLLHPGSLLGGDYLTGVLTGTTPPYEPAYLHDSDPRYRWHAKNYADADVSRNLVVAIDDVCRNYPDLDGIELDFVKLGVHFPETFTPAPPEGGVSVAGRNFLTSKVIENAREITARQGIKLAVRVPEHAIQSHFIGLDVQAWLALKLIDVLIVGAGHAPRSSRDLVDEMVQLGAAHGIPVYAAIAAETPALTNLLTTDTTSDSGKQSVAAWRATALNNWSVGAGAYTFNLFPNDWNPDGSVFLYANVKQVFADIGSAASSLDSGPRCYGLDLVRGGEYDMARRHFSRMAHLQYGTPVGELLNGTIEQPIPDPNYDDSVGTADATLRIRTLDLDHCALLYKGNPRLAPTVDRTSLPDVLPRLLFAKWNAFTVHIGEDVHDKTHASAATITLSADGSLPSDVVEVRINSLGTGNATATLVVDGSQFSSSDALILTALRQDRNNVEIRWTRVTQPAERDFDPTPRMLTQLDITIA